MSKRSRHVNPELSRRQFLSSLTAGSLLGLSTCPAAALFTSIIAGQSQKAWAAELGLNVCRLVQIYDSGGSARYMGPCCLTPVSTTNFDPGPMVNTQYVNVNGRYSDTTYASPVVKNGLQFATMWGHMIPTPSGGLRPLSDLLDNMICLQGMTTTNAGHDASRLYAHLPTGALYSTAAASGDNRDAPFPAINMSTSNYVYKSLKSRSATALGVGGNPLNTLLTAFTPVGTTPFQQKFGLIRPAYKSLFKLLDEEARKGHVGSEALSQTRDSAVDLLETNFTELGNQWTALLDKYTTLVSQAIFGSKGTLVGVDDLPVGHGGNGPAELYRVNGDLDYNLHLAGDLRDVITANTTVTNLARYFAVTEYVLVNNLCGSISFSLGGLDGLGPAEQGGPGIGMGNDQHGTAIFPSLYFNVLRYRAIYACILGLIDKLKEVGMFDDTVIRHGGDFSRHPRLDKVGSDHGFTGAQYSIWNGRINGTYVLGKLKKDSLGRKSWGGGAFDSILNRQLNLRDLHILTAHLIGVQLVGGPPPFTSDLPVAILGSNGLVPRIETSVHVV